MHRGRGTLCCRMAAWSFKVSLLPVDDSFQRVTHLNSTSRKHEPADVAENSTSMFSDPSNFPEINKQVEITSDVV